MLVENDFTYCCIDNSCNNFLANILGYTNLDSEKGFEFFQKFLRTSGIVDELEKLGIEEGDTVRMYGLQFDYLR